MGLFDKKNCDICGEKIGLMGNRKLEDGNLCKDCAKKLSPFFSERRSSTVEEIRQQLAYREQNRQNLLSFRATRSYGNNTKIYIDDNTGCFVVTRSMDFQKNNPDIIRLSDVNSCNIDIKEHERELFTKNANGERVSYNPKRYEYEYEFTVNIYVNSPYFNEISFELSSGRRPDSPYTDFYREYQRQGDEIRMALTGGTMGAVPAGFAGGYRTQGAGFSSNFDNMQSMNAVNRRQQEAQTISAVTGAINAVVSGVKAASISADSWQCTSCGALNNGKFCSGCGAPRSSGGYRCDKCGWEPAQGEAPPRFCPQCGDPFDANDMK